MSDTGDGNFDYPAASAQPASEPTARFGQTAPGTLIQNVHLTTDKIDIHPANLAALERLAGHSPETASQLIEGSKFVAKQNTKKFLGGALITGIVCCTILICSAYTIVNAGFWAGIAFFFACMAAFALMVAALTGKVQDISWIVRMVPGAGGEAKKEPSDS